MKPGPRALQGLPSEPLEQPHFEASYILILQYFWNNLISVGLCSYLVGKAEFLPDFPDEWEEFIQFSFINSIWLWKLGFLSGPCVKLKLLDL